jgi:lipopolysaccharide export system permease protein
MRLLDRYLIREWLFPFLICLIGFMVLWIAFDLIEELDEFAGLGVAEIARYYCVTLPGNFFVVVPVALLLSLMYSINQHSRHHEFIAIRNAGVGMFRMSAPYLLVGLLLSAGMYWSNEKWLPSGLRQGEIIKSTRAEGGENALGPEWISDVKFRNDEARRSWQIPNFNRTTGEMRGAGNNPIIISWKWDDEQPERVIMAERGTWENADWTFQQVRDYKPTEGFPEAHPITFHQTLQFEEFNETPRQIEGELKIAPLFDKRAHKRWSVSLAEIDSYRRIHPNIAPQKKTILNAQYQARLAEPLTCFIVVLIAIPFAAPSGRRNAAAGVATGILVCLAFFIVQQLSMALGIGALFELVGRLGVSAITLVVSVKTFEEKAIFGFLSLAISIVLIIFFRPVFPLLVPGLLLLLSIIHFSEFKKLFYLHILFVVISILGSILLLFTNSTALATWIPLAAWIPHALFGGISAWQITKVR